VKGIRLNNHFYLNVNDGSSVTKYKFWC